MMNWKVVYSISNRRQSQIIKPIRRAVAIIDVISDIGIDNIPDEMKTEWLEDIEMISSLESLELSYDRTN